MATNYAYFYASIEDPDGFCWRVRDTSNYILNRLEVPIPEYNVNYAMKYYHPIPDSVESFDDFHGQWYEDADYTIPWNP